MRSWRLGLKLARTASLLSPSSEKCQNPVRGRDKETVSTSGHKYDVMRDHKFRMRFTVSLEYKLFSRSSLNTTNITDSAWMHRNICISKRSVLKEILFPMIFVFVTSPRSWCQAAVLQSARNSCREFFALPLLGPRAKTRRAESRNCCPGWGGVTQSV